MEKFKMVRNQTYYKSLYNGDFQKSVGTKIIIDDITFYLEKSNNFWNATEHTTGVLANHKHHKTRKSLVDELTSNIDVIKNILNNPTRHLKETIKKLDEFKKGEC